MSTTKTVKSFIKQFVAVVTGDSSEAQAQKVYRQASSGLSTQISVLTGDSVGKEDAVTDAKEKLALARVNNGNLITNREYYVQNLLDAKNNLTKAEEELAKHNAKLEFLKGELTNLDADEPAEEEAA